MTVRILQGEVRAMLRTLEPDSVDCVITSPPYWGLRSYLADDHPDKHLEIGCERTLSEHLAVLVEVFGEVRRVMKPQATLWLNYGDCYATSPNGRSAAATKAAGNDDRTFRDKPFSTVGPICVPDAEAKDRRGVSNNKGAGDGSRSRIQAGGFLKPKDLCMVANRLAISLQDAGWWVRSEIVWGKNNPMPDSSGKYRPSTAHEKIFLLTKSAKSYYDAEAVAMPCSESTHARLAQNVQAQNGRRHAGFNERYFGERKLAAPDSGIRNNSSMDETLAVMPETRYLRNYEPAPLSVWEMSTQPFSEAHFATFPPELVERAIAAGCPLGGLILDPFGGAGTTGLVADRMRRDAILIELNQQAIDISERRLHNDGGIFMNIVNA